MWGRLCVCLVDGGGSTVGPDVCMLCCCGLQCRLLFLMNGQRLGMVLYPTCVPQHQSCPLYQQEGHVWSLWYYVWVVSLCDVHVCVYSVLLWEEVWLQLLKHKAVCIFKPQHPSTPSWVSLWSGISVPSLTQDRVLIVGHVSSTNLAFQTLSVGGISEICLHLQSFLFLGFAAGLQSVIAAG